MEVLCSLPLPRSQDTVTEHLEIAKDLLGFCRISAEVPVASSVESFPFSVTLSWVWGSGLRAPSATPRIGVQRRRHVEPGPADVLQCGAPEWTDLGFAMGSAVWTIVNSFWWFRGLVCYYLLLILFLVLVLNTRPIVQ